MTGRWSKRLSGINLQIRSSDYWRKLRITIQKILASTPDRIPIVAAALRIFVVTSCTSTGIIHFMIATRFSRLIETIEEAQATNQDACQGRATDGASLTNQLARVGGGSGRGSEAGQFYNTQSRVGSSTPADGPTERRPELEGFGSRIQAQTGNEARARAECVSFGPQCRQAEIADTPSCA